MQELPNKHLLAQHQARLIHSQWTGEVAIRVEGGELWGWEGSTENLETTTRGSLFVKEVAYSHIRARGDPRVTDCCSKKLTSSTNDSKTTMLPCSHAKETKSHHITKGTPIVLIYSVSVLMFRSEINTSRRVSYGVAFLDNAITHIFCTLRWLIKGTPRNCGSRGRINWNYNRSS